MGLTSFPPRRTIFVPDRVCPSYLVQPQRLPAPRFPFLFGAAGGCQSTRRRIPRRPNFVLHQTCLLCVARSLSSVSGSGSFASPPPFSSVRGIPLIFTLEFHLGIFGNPPVGSYFSTGHSFICCYSPRFASPFPAYGFRRVTLAKHYEAGCAFGGWFLLKFLC